MIKFLCFISMIPALAYTEKDVQEFCLESTNEFKDRHHELLLSDNLTEDKIFEIWFSLGAEHAFSSVLSYLDEDEN